MQLRGIHATIKKRTEEYPQRKEEGDISFVGKECGMENTDATL